MSKLKSKLLLVLCVLIGFIGYTTYSNAEQDDYSTYDYYIKNMDVQVEVNDKREYIITETIDAYFNRYKHGLVRNIPLRSSLEGYKIEDITIEGGGYVSKSDSYLIIRMGDENNYVIGDNQYVIQYTLKHLEDGERDADYVYLNIIGDEWDAPIAKFTSTITYPSEFKFKDINLTSGYRGERTNNFANYNREENKIKISSSDKVLSPNQGVTINVSFEEGAFINAPKDKMRPFVKVIHLVGMIVLIVTIIEVIKSVKRHKRIPVIKSQYPPSGLKSIDVAYIYYRNISYDAIISMIYGWASEGYINIDVDRKRDIVLTKLRELEETYPYGRYLFRKIFSYSKIGTNVVKSSDLQYKLSQEFTAFKLSVKNKYKEDERFNLRTPKVSVSIRKISLILIVLSIFIKSKSGIDPVSFGTSLCLCLSSAILVGALILVVSEYRYNMDGSFGKNLLNIGPMWLVFAMILFFVIALGGFMSYYIRRLSLLEFVLDNAPIVSILLTTMILPEKTAYEEEICGRIMGFKEFVKNIKEDDIEEILIYDKDYFSNILPYAQALNISDPLADSFKNIGLPQVYNSSSGYHDYHRFSNFDRMNRGMRNMGRDAFRPQPSSSSESSSGGGFSGGGCSGGGSGGGGGSSW